MDFVILVIMLMVWGFISFSESATKASVERDLKQAEEQSSKRIEAENEFKKKYINEEFENKYRELPELAGEIRETEIELRQKFPELNKLESIYCFTEMILLARRGLIPKRLSNYMISVKYGNFVRYYNEILIRHGIPELYMYTCDAMYRSIFHFFDNKIAIKDTVDSDYDSYKIITWPEIASCINDRLVYI